MMFKVMLIYTILWLLTSFAEAFYRYFEMPPDSTIKWLLISILAFHLVRYWPTPTGQPKENEVTRRTGC